MNECESTLGESWGCDCGVLCKSIRFKPSSTMEELILGMFFIFSMQPAVGTLAFHGTIRAKHVYNRHRDRLNDGKNKLPEHLLFNFIH